MKSQAVVIEATKVKTRFGEISEKVQAADIAVTRRGTVEAYIVSPERYEAYVQRMGVNEAELDRLTAEYDAMVAGMQTPTHEAAVAQLMASTEGELQSGLDAYYAKYPVVAIQAEHKRKFGISKKVERKSVRLGSVLKKGSGKLRIVDAKAARTAERAKASIKAVPSGRKGK